MGEKPTSAPALPQLLSYIWGQRNSAIPYRGVKWEQALSGGGVWGLQTVDKKTAVP